MTGFRLFLAPLTLFLATTIISCQSAFEEPDTAITLRVTSDSELDRLDIIFQNPDGDEQPSNFRSPPIYEMRPSSFLFVLVSGFKIRFLFGSKGGGVTHL